MLFLFFTMTQQIRVLIRYASIAESVSYTGSLHGFLFLKIYTKLQKKQAVFYLLSVEQHRGRKVRNNENLTVFLSFRIYFKNPHTNPYTFSHYCRRKTAYQLTQNVSSVWGACDYTRSTHEPLICFWFTLLYTPSRDAPALYSINRFCFFLLTTCLPLGHYLILVFNVTFAASLDAFQSLIAHVMMI